MKFKSIISITIPFLFLLASCDSQSFVTQTPVFTVRPTLAYSPTPTATINSTFTRFPTFSPKQITAIADRARDIENMNFRFTAVPATIEARGAKCKEGFELELGLNVLDSSTDKWTIFTCSPVPANRKDRWTPGVVDYGTRYTQLIKTDFSQIWTIYHNKFDYSLINRPDAMLAPWHWTPDGNYLYLVPIKYPGTSGSLRVYFEDGHHELYRLNLNSGDFEIILPHTPSGYSYSLSPDEQYLVYSSLDEKSDGEHTVHIRNMVSSSEHTISLNGDYTVTGGYAWVSDSSRLFFASALRGWENNNHGSASLFMLTLKNMYLQTILLNDNRLLVPVSQWEDGKTNYWVNNNYLYVHSLKYETTEYFSDLALNIQSGNVIVLATPEPHLIGSPTPSP